MQERTYVNKEKKDLVNKQYREIGTVNLKFNSIMLLLENLHSNSYLSIYIYLSIYDII